MTTPRIEEMQGRKIGEDKYTEHWSLDGSTYVQVPKWVIAQAHQAGVRDAMEIVEGLRKLYMTRDTDFSNEHGTNVADVYNQALDDTIKALQDNQPLP